MSIELNQVVVFDDAYATEGGQKVWKGIIPSHYLPYVKEARASIGINESPFRDFNPFTGEVAVKESGLKWFANVISNANSSFSDAE